MKSQRKKISGARKVVGYVLLFLCAAFIVYCAAVMVYRLTTVFEAKRWSVITRFLAEFGITSLLSLPALDLRFGIFSWARNRALKVSGMILRTVSCLVAALFLALGAAIVITGEQTGTEPVENVCVLGLAIDGENLPKDLEHRLDRALEYKSEHPEARFIVTGGNSEDPYYSEAAYMSRYLSEHGFDGEVGELIVESNARTTVENFKYTSEYVDKTEPLAVITNKHHMFRATGIAKKQGFSVVAIPAKAEPAYYPENVMWEMICSFFQILKGNIAF